MAFLGLAASSPRSSNPATSANAFSAIPEAKGLFNPENDKDACGVGFVAQLSKGAVGRWSPMH